MFLNVYIHNYTLSGMTRSTVHDAYVIRVSGFIIMFMYITIISVCNSVFFMMHQSKQLLVFPDIVVCFELTKINAYRDILHFSL